MAHLKLELKTPISFSTLFSFFFLITIICVLSYSDEEGVYMLKLLHALDSPPFDWSNNTQPCSWSSVSCGKSGNVLEINLGSMSLKGIVPSGLNNSLIFLTKLDLSNNAFHGPLPSLANIDKLQDVDLSDNNFTSIPEGCFQGLVSLQNLYLGNNIHLTPWKFPTDLVDSSPLKYFDFRATNLMGSLPDIFDSFPNLQGVVLSNNNPSGVLPKSFARSKIYILFLNDQNLSGTIEILSSMTSLSWVWLQANRFEGPIPNLSNCTNLQYLWLQDNRLAGAVPSSLVSLSRLHEAFLDNNYLGGPLPMFGRNNVTVSLGANNIFLEISASFGYPIVLTRSWIGNNPCKGWSFISCEGTKIRTVNLTRLNLTGNISPKFGDLSDLWNLYLGDNNLWGEIPESLATLPQLKVLDVSNNGLSGNIPMFSPRVRLSTEGNDNLQLSQASAPSPSADSGLSPGPSAVSGLSPSPSADSGLTPSPSIDVGHRRSSSAVSPLLIAGASAAGVGVIVISIVVIYNRKRCLSLIQKMMFMKTITFIDNNFEDFIPTYGSLTLKRYNYSEVKKMTNSFRNKLGQGGYGTVYKATLIDGRQVAVKVLGESNGSGEEFINEVASIRRTSHVNIVSLLGFCYEKKKRALIYEFMPNGSLDKFIYKKGSPNAICDLDWSTLFQITISIARGLEYLHHGCNTRILHLDIKPQNILLDEDFCPKIADFGLAKICKKRESIVSILGTRGTPGYIAPEVFSRIYGGVSHKYDVYSYGMLIIEVVGGRENYDNGGSCTSEAYFPDWIYKDLEQGNIPSRCLASTDEDNDMIMKITLVSLWCIQANPSNRPSMNKVVEMLEGPLQLVPYPPKPILHSPEKSLIRFSNISYSNTQETNSIIAEENGSIKENEFT